MIPLDKVGKCQTKAIQTDLGIISHNQAYPGIIQAHSGMFKILRNPGMLRTVVYLKPW